VRTTLARQAAGGRVVAVVAEAANGKLIYSADVAIAGRIHQVNVAADGTLIACPDGTPPPR
jgi:hypothetical protein